MAIRLKTAETRAGNNERNTVLIYVIESKL